MDFSNMEVTIDHIADAGAKIKAYATAPRRGILSRLDQGRRTGQQL